jgi:hypothetical protein
MRGIIGSLNGSLNPIPYNLLTNSVPGLTLAAVIVSFAKTRIYPALLD